MFKPKAYSYLRASSGRGVEEEGSLWGIALYFSSFLGFCTLKALLSYMTYCRDVTVRRKVALWHFLLIANIRWLAVIPPSALRPCGYLLMLPAPWACSIDITGVVCRWRCWETAEPLPQYYHPWQISQIWWWLHCQHCLPVPKHSFPFDQSNSHHM